MIAWRMVSTSVVSHTKCGRPFEMPEALSAEDEMIGTEEATSRRKVGVSISWSTDWNITLLVHDHEDEVEIWQHSNIIHVDTNYATVRHRNLIVLGSMFQFRVHYGKGCPEGWWPSIVWSNWWPQGWALKGKDVNVKIAQWNGRIWKISCRNWPAPMKEFWHSRVSRLENISREK